MSNWKIGDKWIDKEEFDFAKNYRNKQMWLENYHNNSMKRAIELFLKNSKRKSIIEIMINDNEET